MKRLKESRNISATFNFDFDSSFSPMNHTEHNSRNCNGVHEQQIKNSPKTKNNLRNISTSNIVNNSNSKVNYNSNSKVNYNSNGKSVKSINTNVNGTVSNNDLSTNGENGKIKNTAKFYNKQLSNFSNDVFLSHPNSFYDSHKKRNNNIFINSKNNSINSEINILMGKNDIKNEETASLATVADPRSLQSSNFENNFNKNLNHNLKHNKMRSLSRTSLKGFMQNFSLSKKTNNPLKYEFSESANVVANNPPQMKKSKSNLNLKNFGSFIKSRRFSFSKKNQSLSLASPYNNQNILNNANNNNANNNNANNENNKLNINTATVEALMTLPSINRQTAENIVSYRYNLGGFNNIYDLAPVSGVGADTFNMFRSDITIQDRVHKDVGAKKDEESNDEGVGGRNSRTNAVEISGGRNAGNVDGNEGGPSVFPNETDCKALPLFSTSENVGKEISDVFNKSTTECGFINNSNGIINNPCNVDSGNINNIIEIEKNKSDLKNIVSIADENVLINSKNNNNNNNITNSFTPSSGTKTERSMNIIASNNSEGRNSNSVYNSEGRNSNSVYNSEGRNSNSVHTSVNGETMSHLVDAQDCDNFESVNAKSVLYRNNVVNHHDGILTGPTNLIRNSISYGEKNNYQNNTNNLKKNTFVTNNHNKKKKESKTGDGSEDEGRTGCLSKKMFHLPDVLQQQ